MVQKRAVQAAPVKKTKTSVKVAKRSVRKVPKKKVSVLVLVVLAMASAVTVAWLLEK